MTSSVLVLLVAGGLLCLLLGDLVYRRRRYRAHTTASVAPEPPPRRSLEYASVLSRLRPPAAPPEESSVPLYLVLDLQTTGLSIAPGHEARILEAAWLLLDEQYRDLGHRVMVVRQEEVGSAAAQSVHRLDRRTVQQLGVTEETLLDALLPLLRQARVVVCHNVRFDLSILLGTLRRVRPEEAEGWLVDKEAFCTMVLGAATDPQGHHRYPSLRQLAGAFTGLRPEDMDAIDNTAWRHVCLTRICLAALRPRWEDDRFPAVRDYLDRRVPASCLPATASR